jgi:hypothetical protein
METTLILLVGGSGRSGVERELRRARQAAARDLLESLLEADCVSQAVVAADDPAWAQTLSDLPIRIDLDSPGEPFHFGQRLADLIRHHRVERALYAGGGAAPLMDATAWQEVTDCLSDDAHAVVTNNVHSSDWVAFHPSEKLLPLVAAQERDNALAWELVEQANLPVRSLPPSAASRFDLDTPADLLIARAHPGVGRHLREVLEELDWPTEPVEGVLEVMTREGGHLTVIGRSSAAAGAALENHTRCWVRMLIEERGMIASGRLDRGEVRSLLADLVEEIGVEAFFNRLGELSEAVLMDNRVILGARGLWPSAADRFNADLFRWQNVQEPFLQRFSQAASEANVPILMGGQSVVSGGLLALLEVLVGRKRTQ